MAFRDEGTFDVICGTNGKVNNVNLSKDEEMILCYMCHLKALELWDGCEQIHDMHHIRKPIIITNFLEYLSEPQKTTKMIEKENMGRQVIVMCPLSNRQYKKQKEFAK